MWVIPVLDLMNGQVVQGMRGEREHYRPLQSGLTPLAEPAAVARALHAETGCQAFYIADLDAIQGQGDHRAVIQALAAAPGIELWVDAGVSDPAAARRLLEAGAGRVIIGSETLTSLDMLQTLRDTLPAQRRLFSLDMAGGRVLSHTPALKGQTPAAGLSLIAQAGWSHVILLTLDRVGTGSGLDWPLLAAARAEFPHLFLIAGGGVRTPDELRQLRRLGIDGVLVASALHRGWITRQDL